MTQNLIESIAGTVQMADGTTRAACKNTYTLIVFSANGETFEKKQTTRIEFELFTNINHSLQRRFRKTTAKQADSFKAS